MSRPIDLDSDDPRPIILDAFGCQGGAAMGYHRAGFRVWGNDHDAQPKYPFEFAQMDALDFIAEYGPYAVAGHGSPPCQLFTLAQRIQGNDHPDLIAPTRDAFEALGIPYVIENVEGAREHLVDPVMLCGAMFGLGTYRHRLFEASFPLEVPDHPKHEAKTTKMGRRPKPGEMMHVVGNFSGVEQARKAMGIDWMTRDGLRESIPPAYTEYIGKQLIDTLAVAA
jgi:DNA (cytosine-5)-methyltransferase 1